MTENNLIDELYSFEQHMSKLHQTRVSLLLKYKSSSCMAEEEDMFVKSARHRRSTDNQRYT